MLTLAMIAMFALLNDVTDFHHNVFAAPAALKLVAFHLLDVLYIIKSSHDA